MGICADGLRQTADIDLTFRIFLLHRQNHWEIPAVVSSEGTDFFQLPHRLDLPRLQGHGEHILIPDLPKDLIHEPGLRKAVPHKTVRRMAVITGHIHPDPFTELQTDIRPPDYPFPCGVHIIHGHFIETKRKIAQYLNIKSRHMEFIIHRSSRDILRNIAEPPLSPGADEMNRRHKFLVHILHRTVRQRHIQLEGRRDIQRPQIQPFQLLGTLPADHLMTKLGQTPLGLRLIRGCRFIRRFHYQIIRNILMAFLHQGKYHPGPVTTVKAVCHSRIVV